MNNLLRDLRDWFGDTARLDAVLDRFRGPSGAPGAFPPKKRDSVRLGCYYGYCSLIQGLLGQYGEALSDCKQFGEADPSSAARLQAQRGDYDQAEAGAKAIAARWISGNGRSLYTVGAGQWLRWLQSFATIALWPAARREELGEKYGRQAVQWLQEAQTLKYLSAPSTRYSADDRDLGPLRSRDDFRALLSSIVSHGRENEG